ncbi:MAG: CDP-diacylglycerol--serine O-phosphatidyltransferase [Bacteroides sp.]|nr:CDP-diacylglycerol--serine O-phosphatidyltransferase [Bacteroides sp.]MCM1414123.1 CDP-diacylglycerol--serine O-phosphatidyltransferase [Bacteroides sp.]MCM1470989.1 CDP-diacylglycerol--serine O-phosphatidyltransferase [Bacteroides sp.]
MFDAIRKSIPNTITCLNLLSGVMACIFAFRFCELYGSLYGYQWAFICIGAAAVFDFCDGAAARLLKAYSPLGKELDSLADLVSFGVAPALLLFNCICLANTNEMSPWAFVALFIPAMGALRLARFNIDDRQTTSFIGLPIPAGAIFWIGLIAWFHPTIEGTRLYLTPLPNWATAVIIVGVSLLMVSNIHLFSLKFKNFRIWENIQRYLIIVIAIALVAIFGLEGLMWTIVAYIFLSTVKIKVEIEDNKKDI